MLVQRIDRVLMTLIYRVFCHLSAITCLTPPEQRLLNSFSDRNMKIFYISLCFIVLIDVCFSVKKWIGDVHTSAAFIQPLVNMENEIVNYLKTLQINEDSSLQRYDFEFDFL